MATRHPARRKSSKAAAHRPRPKHASKSQASFSANLRRAALSRPARAAYAIVGTIGLAALAAAILGPKRLERTVFKPLQQAVAPQAEKLWEQSSPLRAQLAGLFRRAGDEREKLARDFQSWIGRFHAS